MSIINLQDKNLYVIGGAVRDKLLNKESFDIDLTYVGDATEFAKTIKGAEILRVNDAFGTVRIKFEGKEIDIASTRSETYPQKGHLPSVKNIGCSLKEDVLRRDFTINALAQNTLTGEIIDFTNGLADLKTETLRVLHDNSFVDDPTRLVRMLKFSIRFGFTPDEHTATLARDYLENVNYDMSFKRLKKELEETFNLNSQAAFDRFINQKIYRLVTPETPKLPKFDFEPLINKYKPEIVWIIYAGMISGISVLPLTAKEKLIVENFETIKTKTYSSDFEIYKNFEGVPIESIIMFSAFNSTVTERYLEHLQNISLEITGKDLKNAGIPPSKKYAEFFDYAISKKIKNPRMTKYDETELAKEFFNV